MIFAEFLCDLGGESSWNLQHKTKTLVQGTTQLISTVNEYNGDITPTDRTLSGNASHRIFPRVRDRTPSPRLFAFISLLGLGRQPHFFHDHLVARLGVQEIKTRHVLNLNQPRFPFLISEFKVMERLLFAS
jgi:hypothetical protein